MDDTMQSQSSSKPILVAAGEDCYGEHRSLGISKIAFKVCPRNSSEPLVIENVFHAKGGPPRHLHYDQDEWFYVLEGEFVLEVGAERFHLVAGDSVLAPRQVAHVWAHVGDGQGRILITFLPSGQMEPFFRAVTPSEGMPPQSPELFRAHGMELLGPPMALA